MDKKFMRYDTKIGFACGTKKKKRYNKQFAIVDISICYHGGNKNGTYISKETITNALPSLYGIPIVGEFLYKDGEDDFGTHGGKIVIDDSGIKFEQTTKPYGFITQEAVDNAKWETVLEKDGHTEHEYLRLTDCVVWKDRYEEVEKILESDHPQSMEIQIDKSSIQDDGYLHIDEFTFSAACILGTNVAPCFESASIGRHFELDEFANELQQMMSEYKKFQTEENNNLKEGETTMELTKFVEALSAIKIENTENNRYVLLNVTDLKVNVIDTTDYKAYAFDYAIEGPEDAEGLVIDFDSKVEMSLSACDKITSDGFVEFSISNVIDSASDKKTEECTAKLQDEFNARIEEIRSQYEELKSCYELAMDELTEYRNEIKAREEQKHIDEVDSVILEFSKKLGKVPEFLVYKARLDYKKSVDEVKHDLILMAGRSIMDSQSKANFSYTPVSTNLETVNKQKETTSRYGHLLDKYAR